jgi:tetratricopeptide (TPR) repeat protein
MLTIKNRGGSALAGERENHPLISSNACKLVLLLALLAGCTPPGPRALLQGKRLLDQGKYPQAIEKLKAATVLLGGTNALAWNYLGVACQHADELAEAERAYNRALDLNHDLGEVRFNLGCLWLEQNKLEAAKGQFTAYTLRRPNAVEGYLKLGAVQMRTREPAAAEKSFNEALRLSPHDAEAWNGLGLAQLQRGRASEAAQSFESALKQQPDYRPALLNLAIVAQQYLKDHRLALEKYKQYLALKPTPANAADLTATVRQLEQELAPLPRHPATNAVAPLSPKALPSKPAVTNVTRVLNPPKSEPVANPPKPVATNLAKPAPAAMAPKPPAPSANVEVKKLPAEPVLKRAQDVPTAPVPTAVSPAEPLMVTSTAPASVTESKAAKRGFLQRVNPLNLFHSGEPAPVRTTSLGAAGSPPPSIFGSPDATGTVVAAANPSGPAPKGTPGRYPYQSPAKPQPGNREAAERGFAQAAQAEEARQLPEALQAYRLAARQDPSLYAAQYNLGRVATEAGNLPLALTAYEYALAIQPTSLDARYNFALVLKQDNYLTDAVNELEKLLVTFPNDTRSHVALGNLYAQQMRRPAKARQHYLKVLELEPQHPQAGSIRAWLVANPS